jgi:DNA invertase Pin-like site-specific DNA recombinase
MLSDAGRGKFDVVMAWAIDRVGRSLIDAIGIDIITRAVLNFSFEGGI